MRSAKTPTLHRCVSLFYSKQYDTHIYFLYKGKMHNLYWNDDLVYPIIPSITQSTLSIHSQLHSQR